jgi:hypothetical protein
MARLPMNKPQYNKVLRGRGREPALRRASSIKPLPTGSDLALFRASLRLPIPGATQHSPLMQDFYRALARCAQSEK